MVETVAQTSGDSKLNNRIYDYDNLNRVTAESSLDSAGSGYTIEYSYDPAGNRTGRKVRTYFEGAE